MQPRLESADPPMNVSKSRSHSGSIRTLLLAALLFCFAPFARAHGSGGWQVVGQPGFSSADGWCAQIAVSPSGIVHVAYQDHSIGSNRASVQRFINGAWK